MHSCTFSLIETACDINIAKPSCFFLCNFTVVSLQCWSKFFFVFYSLPCVLGTLPHLKAIVLDGNPLKSIRRDILLVRTGSHLVHMSMRCQYTLNYSKSYNIFLMNETFCVLDEHKIVVVDQSANLLMVVSYSCDSNLTMCATLFFMNT